MKIISAQITAQPQSLFDAMPKVIATMEDGKTQEVFEYYPDEISFTADEFIGLTLDEARHLKYIKDKLYLTTTLCTHPASIRKELFGRYYCKKCGVRM